jgi:hypothetical protein
LRDLTWKTDIAHRAVKFDFKVDELDESLDEGFLLGVAKFLNQQVLKRFGANYEFDSSFLTDSEGNKVMRIYISGRENDELDR